MPALTIYSCPRSTLRGLFWQMERYGIGRSRLIRKHPAAFTKEILIPPAFFLLHAVLPLVALLAWWLPAMAMTYGAICGAYWAILLGTGIRVVTNVERIRGGVFVALAIYVTHMGLGWGFLKTILLPN